MATVLVFPTAPNPVPVIDPGPFTTVSYGVVKSLATGKVYGPPSKVKEAA